MKVSQMVQITSTLESQGFGNWPFSVTPSMGGSVDELREEVLGIYHDLAENSAQFVEVVVDLDDVSIMALVTRDQIWISEAYRAGYGTVGGMKDYGIAEKIALSERFWDAVNGRSGQSSGAGN